MSAALQAADFFISRCNDLPGMRDFSDPGATICRVCVIFELKIAEKSFIPGILLHFFTENRSYPANRRKDFKNHSYLENHCKTVFIYHVVLYVAKGIC